jgi:seryl-tRNA synthetase
MLDIKFIEQNKNAVKKAVELKKIKLDIDLLLDLYRRKKKLLKQREDLRAERNSNVEEIKRLVGNETASREELIRRGKNIKKVLQETEMQFREVDGEFQRMMLLVPNIPSEDTPIGNDEKDNVEVKRWGDIPKFDFEPKSHIGLGRDLDLIDFDTGVKVSGFRGYYLKNDAVLLHFAVLWYALNKLIQKGFRPFLPPTLVNEFALVGSGHFPFGKDEVYQIVNPDKLEGGEITTNPTYLTGTAEPSLLAYYADKVLKEKELPIKVCGLTQCYRSEVGSYGKDVKGLYRIHEFMKVEQVIICKANIEESNRWLEELRNISEEILQDLKLPYRVLSICTADMGAGKHKMYDIETWMPSRNSYGETHSDSNLTDWQTRRLNIKYMTKGSEKKYAFSLNNTAIASPRILIAILENYQQKDGSIVIPQMLKPYLNKEKIE